MKTIFVAWNEYHTRNASVSEMMGIPSYHFGKRRTGRLRSLLSYFSKAVKTISLLIRERPDAVIITNSFFLPPLVCFAVSPFTGTKVILDTHSSGIENSFFAYPKFLIKRFARMAALNIVTNKGHRELVESWGGRAFVLPDPPVKIKLDAGERYPVKREKLNICFINTYAEDEPYLEVIACATELPEVDFYITGNNKGRELPELENVLYTGYLKRESYVSLLNTVDAILVLTTRENTFQCGGNEALSVSKPLIISGTEFLRKYFNDACVYVLPEKNSIKEGILQIKGNLGIYGQKIRELLDEKIEESRRGSDKLKEILDEICF